MTTETPMIFEAMKAQLWEEAKGKLRALVMVKGSVQGRPVGDDSEWPWETLQKRVEAFIRDIEDNGLQE